MRLVEVSGPAPFGTIAVNAEEIVTISPEPAASETASEDSPGRKRVIDTQTALDELARLFGSGFIRFDAASTTISVRYVNRHKVGAVMRHPQREDVSYIVAAGMRLPVRGTVDQVIAALKAPS